MNSDTRWHALSSAQTLHVLSSGDGGLTSDDAAQRLALHGPNRLVPPKRRTAAQRFLLQFHDVLIYVLLGSAAVSALLGHWTDAAVILGVVFINAAIGYVQEGRAEQALDAIRNLLAPQALVLRDGARRVVPADALVTGDVVVLGSGDKVTADLRLTSSKTLRVDEAALTGESQPVDKSEGAVACGTALAERYCMAYAGTLVTYGQATGVVVATGEQTELGRISHLLTHVEEVSTPLLRKLAQLGRWLTLAILGFAAATFAFGVLVRGYTAGDMFMAAVGLAVAAIPEGLPAVITITLAIGVQRMAARRAIVRRLPAVETLGSVTVICTDKTGTLTRNEMTVQQVVTAENSVNVSGIGYAPSGAFMANGAPVSPQDIPGLMELARAALLCNDAVLRQRNGEWLLEGDPTEGALLAFALKAGLDATVEAQSCPRTDSIPFESQHRFMATLHHDHAGGAFVYVKGAPERVLDMCRRELRNGATPALDCAAWNDRIETLGASGQRVIALAWDIRPVTCRELTFGDVEHGLVFLGVVGIIDPPREEAVSAIASCRRAGIRVKMITGDHVVTARAIGARLGIGDGTRVLSGTELDGIDDARLRKVVGETDVFARASPEHKLRLVQALQANGEIVAMTGDGVNDAPALKRADVGVALGPNGTEVAKEASDIVIADGNFASIARAVEEGRAVFDNIRKFLVFMLPTDIGEAMVIMLAVAWGFGLPITPVQILWINMVTSVTLGLALAFELPEAHVMKRPPRAPTEPLLSMFLLWRIVFVTALLVTAAMGLFSWEIERGGTIESARAVAINVLVMGEVCYLFNARHLQSTSLSVQGVFGNRHALAAVAILMPLQLVLTYVPAAQRLFGTAGIDAGAWGLILAFGIALFLVVEAEKAARRAWLARHSATPDPYDSGSAQACPPVSRPLRKVP